MGNNAVLLSLTGMDHGGSPKCQAKQMVTVVSSSSNGNNMDVYYRRINRITDACVAILPSTTVLSKGNLSSKTQASKVVSEQSRPIGEGGSFDVEREKQT